MKSQKGFKLTRPKSCKNLKSIPRLRSGLMSPQRRIDYFSPLFTTNVTNAVRSMDQVEGVIVSNNNKPRVTDKVIKLDIDLD